MKPFNEWFRQSPVVKSHSWQKWEDEGHGFLKESKFMITCCRCDRDFAVSDYIDADEFDPDTSETFYCGGSDRCCP